MPTSPVGPEPVKSPNIAPAFTALLRWKFLINLKFPPFGFISSLATPSRYFSFKNMWRKNVKSFSIVAILLTDTGQVHLK